MFRTISSYYTVYCAFLWHVSYIIIGQGVAQGCSMSPILFINQLLDEVEKAENDVKVGGLVFAWV